MKISTILTTIVLQWTFNYSFAATDNQINNVNPDGSFNFGYANNDQGRHYHEAKGNPVIEIRGRYGSKSPTNGRVEETVYTAGPRGFRARGPNIHRKQNLSQVPRRPAGSPKDPLADPSDDPSYKFGFKTKNHSRREESDSSGTVRGDVVYVDDIGERHSVKYTAGANIGYQVENGIPDAPLNIRYNTPLYKAADPTARGRISFERGPDRQYKFLTSSPDQRRAESTGPDGITRGSYSYLDDKGLQRTVQYIAGANIGYKVIQSTVGPNTHIAANSDVPEYSIKAVSNEIAISDNDNNYNTGPSAPTGPGYISSSVSPYNPGTYSPTPYPPSAYSTPISYPSTPRPFSRPESVFINTPSSIGGIDRNYVTPTVPTYPSGPSPLSPSGPSGSSGEDIIYGLLPPKEDFDYTKQYIAPTPSVTTTVFHPSPTYLPSAEAQPQPPFPSYLPTTVHSPTLPTETIIKNKSGQWYYGIPPGGTVRARIQNIDLIPANERALSPSEALRRDEERDAQHKNSHPRE